MKHFLIGDTPVQIFQSRALPDGFMAAVSKTCKYCGKQLDQISNPCLTNDASGQHAPSITIIDCQPQPDDQVLPP